MAKTRWRSCNVASSPPVFTIEIDRSEIEGRLFVDTGRKMKIVIAEQTKTGARIARPIVDAVIATIKTNAIGLMIVDPFVASHRVVENDNPAIELVAGAWAEIADLTGCAIELVHHARKTGGAEVTVDDGRGGSALLAKVRSARTLNGMSEDRGGSRWRRKPPLITSASTTARRTSPRLPTSRLVSARDPSTSATARMTSPPTASASSPVGLGPTPSTA